MKQKTINLKTYHMEASLSNEFNVILTFYGERGFDGEGGRVKINVKFSWYFLRHIHNLFKKVTGFAQSRIDDSGFNGKGE